jgi:hypothetical protein
MNESTQITTTPQIWTPGEFRAMLRISKKTLREARVNGLPVIRTGKRGYRLDAQSLEWMRERGRQMA